MPENFAVAEADHGHIVQIQAVEHKPVVSAAGHGVRGGAKQVVGRECVGSGVLAQVADFHIAAGGDHRHVMGVLSDGIVVKHAGPRRVGRDASEIHGLLGLVGADRLGQRVDRLGHDRPVTALIGKGSERELCRFDIVIDAQRLPRRRSQIFALVDQRLAVIDLNIDVAPHEISREGSRESSRCRRNAHSALPHLLAQIRVPAADQDCCKPGKFLGSGSVPVDPVVAAERLQPCFDRDVIAVLILHSHCLFAQNIRHDFIWIAFREHRQNVVLVVALQKELDLFPAPDRLNVAGRADTDQVFAVQDRVFDIVIEIAGRGQFVLVAKDPPDRFDPQLLADAPRDDIPLDPVLDLHGHLGVQLRMPI